MRCRSSPNDHERTAANRLNGAPVTATPDSPGTIDRIWINHDAAQSATIPRAPDAVR